MRKFGDIFLGCEFFLVAGTARQRVSPHSAPHVKITVPHTSCLGLCYSLHRSKKIYKKIFITYSRIRYPKKPRKEILSTYQSKKRILKNWYISQVKGKNPFHIAWNHRHSFFVTIFYSIILRYNFYKVFLVHLNYFSDLTCSMTSMWWTNLVQVFWIQHRRTRSIPDHGLCQDSLQPHQINKVIFIILTD